MQYAVTRELVLATVRRSPGRVCNTLLTVVKFPLFFCVFDSRTCDSAQLVCAMQGDRYIDRGARRTNWRSPSRSLRDTETEVAHGRGQNAYEK